MNKTTCDVTIKRGTVIVTGTAMFMTVMDTQIVNVALATITRDFHTTTSSVQWVITAYALSLAVGVPASGWVGDRYGTRRTFLVACALFTAASALCAAAPSLVALVAMRVLQGLAGGLLIPVAYAMMYRAHPPAERVAIARTMTLLTVLAPTTAPLIGGALVSALSWRWIFLVNVPFGAALVPFAARRLREYRDPCPGPFDPAGLLLGGPGLGLVLYAITDGPIAGWSTARVWGSAIAGAALLMAFVRAELRRSHPLLDLRLLAVSRLLRACCTLQLLQQVAFIGPLVFTALYVQEARGYSPLISGTTTLPEALAIGCASGLVVRLYPRVGPRRLVAGGFAVLAVASLLLAQMDGHTSLWLARAWTAALGLGTAFVILPLQAAGLAQISARDIGHASALSNTAQRTGSAAAVAVLSTVLAFSAGSTIHPSATAFAPVFLTATGFAVAGLMLSTRISDADAANTMRRMAPTGAARGTPA